MRIRRKRKRSAVRPPCNANYIDAEMCQQFRRAAFTRHNVQLRRRRRRRIPWIGKVTAAIETHVHPVVNSPFESLRKLTFERRRFVSLPGRWSSPRERDPAIVGTEDGHPADAGN